MTVYLPWFEGDKEGLAELVERQGKAFIIFELLQNAFDEDGVSVVSITFEPIEGRRGLCQLTVGDDSPEGFRDLSHAYTLFAKSYKKSDPQKRGRFNLGEKLVLAICEKAEVISTTGSVIFDNKGRHHSKRKLQKGTVFNAAVKVTRKEWEDICTEIYSVIIPNNIEVWFNGEILKSREPIHTFITSLPTEIADGDGKLKPTVRQTEVKIFEPTIDESPCIYEMGIPVVETDCKWHIDIQQKVPLNMQRDNVKPSYARTLAVLVYNEMHKNVTDEDISSSWIRTATDDKRVTEKAFNHAIDKRFGTKRVVRDPTDPESVMNAVSHGYSVVNGRSMSAGEWANSKRFGSIASSSSADLGFATKKPYSENGDPAEIISPSQYSDGMKNIVEYSKVIGQKLLGIPITVVVVNKMNSGIVACFNKNGELNLSVQGLGRHWFDNGPTTDVDALLLHEFAHFYESNHLDKKYHKALSNLGAKLKALAIENPDLFKPFHVNN